ncbi:MAG: Inner rane component of cytoplasmic domain [Blastocatellia bacterium]|nr:Inner rane component of cytoplasmic domain [Blastocatellia bacterium]
MGLLDSIRRWVDGEGSEDPLEAADEQVKPRRIWEEFLVKVAREVEAAMQREMFTPPGGVTYIPREYIVYLSSEDDKDWQGDKRRGLEQGLFHVLSERARELSGSTQLAAKSFAVELRVDGTLKKGEFRVQAVWDETEGGHTMVSVRPGAIAPGTQSESAGDVSAVTQGEGDAEPTEGDMTVVRPRIVTLYSIEVWRDGVRQAVVPITKNEITIGRGSKSTTVDLPLKGDVEVSRVHATLQLDEEGRYWLTPKGRNPTLVSGREVPREERISVQPDEKIAFCTYVLRIQPK